MDAIYNFLVGTEDDPGIIPKALRALYISVYGSVFAATGNPAIAHTAGYKSNEVFVIPIKILEEALSCVANAIVEGLKDLIVQLLESLLENVDRLVWQNSSLGLLLMQLLMQLLMDYLLL
jgi:hypothetical protein